MKLLICLFALAATAMSESNEELLRSSTATFTANFFQEVVKVNPGESFVTSPFSVMIPLAQLALASVGESHNEILKSIGLPDDNTVKAVYSDATKQLRDVKGVDLKIANRVYIREGDDLNEQFAVMAKDVFDTEVKNVDFTKNTEAAQEINTWVEEKTNNRIKDLISPNLLDASTAAVLVNAIYFKGKWAHPFDKNLTQDLDFHVSKEKTITLPTMYKSEEFKYGESRELNAKVLELPYNGDEASLLIVLPNEIDGINSLVENLKDLSAMTKAVDNMYINQVQVQLPKFKIETTLDIASILKKLNVKKLFQPGQANLDNLLKKQSDLSVSDATQKAFIEVNEEGAEAAAATGFGISYLSAIITEKKQFTADHPFVFFLMEKNNILFSGVFQS